MRLSFSRTVNRRVLFTDSAHHCVFLHVNITLGSLFSRKLSCVSHIHVTFASFDKHYIGGALFTRTLRALLLTGKFRAPVLPSRHSLHAAAPAGERVEVRKWVSGGGDWLREVAATAPQLLSLLKHQP